MWKEVFVHCARCGRAVKNPVIINNCPYGRTCAKKISTNKKTVTQIKDVLPYANFVDSIPASTKRVVDQNQRINEILDTTVRVRSIVSNAFLIGGSAIHSTLTNVRHTEDVDLALQSATVEELQEISDELDNKIKEYKFYRLSRKNPNLLSKINNIKVSITNHSRRFPIELETVEWKGVKIPIPTNGELARMKAVAIIERDAPRDYADLVYLHEYASIVPALKNINDYYVGDVLGRLIAKLSNPEIILTRFNEIKWTRSRDHYTKEQLFEKLKNIAIELYSKS